VVKALEDYGIQVTIFDPWANPEEVKHEYGLNMDKELTSEKYEAIVLGVAHNEFLKMNFENLKKDNAIIYDVKGILNNCSDGRL